MSPLYLLPYVVLGSGTYTDFPVGGTVADLESETPPQARVSIFTETGTALGEGQTDETGRFGLTVAAVADQHVSLRVSAAGYYTEWVVGWLSELGDVGVSLEYMAICRPVEDAWLERTPSVPSTACYRSLCCRLTAP